MYHKNPLFKMLQTYKINKKPLSHVSYFVVTYELLLLGRPTELDEKDVYLCEERYNEHDKDFKKLKSLKVCTLKYTICGSIKLLF